MSEIITDWWERLKEAADMIAELTRRLEAADATIEQQHTEIQRLRSELASRSSIIAVDAERLRAAGQRVGIIAGCDTASEMADEIESLRADLAAAKAGAVSVATVLTALCSYRCQFHQYDDNGGGMGLLDVLTPDGDTDVSRGRDELDLLADHIAVAIDLAVNHPSPPAKNDMAALYGKIPAEESDEDFLRQVQQKQDGAK